MHVTARSHLTVEHPKTAQLLLKCETTHEQLVVNTANFSAFLSGQMREPVPLKFGPRTGNEARLLVLEAISGWYNGLVPSEHKSFPAG